MIGPGAGEVRIGTNVTSYAFDVSVDEIFSSLCFGGAVHVVPYETSLDGLCFARYIVDNGINTAFIMPDLLSDVADAFEALGSLGRLLCLITGVSPKEQRLLQRFRDFSPSLKIFNGYGPTETTVRVSAHEYKTATDLKKDVPIGKVLPSHQIYIVDQHLQPVPIGVRGEILIGGVGVSRGYLNRPDLTAERFIANPFSPELSRLLYRSGDIGRYCDDGTIEFLDRSDSQVKIRGHRIELREIELVVESHLDVATCHADTVRFAEDDVRLVAYVVCTGAEH
jgi:non-ribosomal peptide synthetase component F